MAIRMQQRRGTAAQWTSGNPVLAAGEIGFETDTGKFKIGNGVANWATLNYFTDANSILGGISGTDLPATLDTLNELAAAINDDPNFFSTIATNLSNHEADTTNVHGIADTAALATKTYADSAVSTHNDDTTGVHGIADTSALATKSGTEVFTNKTISYANNVITVQVNNVSDLTASAAELNVLDGITASTAELNTLDGITASSSELNILDGATLSTTELNYVDGVTAPIQTQLDAKLSSSTAASTYAPLASPTFTGTVTLPTGTVTSGMIADGTIVNADISGTAAIALSKLATDPLARANHTGTQLASTISDFNTAVRTNRLDQMAAPTASVSMNSQKITNLATPTADTDAATKLYVDGVTQGLHIHPSVKAATTTNINLSTDLENGDVLDGVTLATGDRVLVKNQTTASQNGIYVVQASGAAVRATDFDEPAEIDSGDFVFVSNGTVNNDTGWVQVNTVGTVGTDPVAFTQFSGAGTYVAGTGLTLTGSTFSINTSTTVDTTTAQTLTNKTISLGSNTVSGTTAQFNSALTDGDFATLAGTETLTNKTLTAPTITGTISLPSTTSIGNVSSTEIGYLDGVTSAIQTQLNAKTPELYTFTADATTARTLALTDNFASLRFTSASAVTVTVPTDASVAFPVGSYIELYQWGAGQVSVVAANAGTTSIRSTDSQTKLRTQYSAGVLIKVAADEWLLTGDLTA